MIHLAPYVRKQVANAVRLNCFNLQNIDYFFIKKKNAYCREEFNDAIFFSLVDS